MGISIDLYQFDLKKFRAKLIEEGAEDEVLLDKILVECGIVIGGQYILLNNELGECSPYYALIDLLDSAFPKLVKRPIKGRAWTTNSQDIISDMWQDTERGDVDCDDIASRLGITLKEE